MTPQDRGPSAELLRRVYRTGVDDGERTLPRRRQPAVYVDIYEKGYLTGLQLRLLQSSLNGAAATANGA